MRCLFSWLRKGIVRYYLSLTVFSPSFVFVEEGVSATGLRCTVSATYTTESTDYIRNSLHRVAGIALVSPENGPETASFYHNWLEVQLCMKAGTIVSCNANCVWAEPSCLHATLVSSNLLCASVLESCASTKFWILCWLFWNIMGDETR
jgi:hypothetical protein